MIILDYSQVCLANIFQFQSDLKKTGADPEAANIIRHAILTGIKSYKKRFGPHYGDIVLACDSKNYWRRGVFEHYKAGRKKQREASGLDWKLVFDTISEIREDLATYFPYKVIHVDGAEADDVIAALCKWSQTNGLIDRGIYEDKQQIMIISSDGDFKQLHKYDNIKQYSPIQKKAVVCNDPAAYLHAHIAKAGDDGIPNVLSPDAVFVTEGARQKKMMADRLEEFTIKGRDACRTDEERRNWDRNNMLINFDCIPEDVERRIMEAYINCNPVKDKMGIYNYLVKKRCRLLLDEIEEF